MVKSFVDGTRFIVSIDNDGPAAEIIINEIKKIIGPHVNESPIGGIGDIKIPDLPTASEENIATNTVEAPEIDINQLALSQGFKLYFEARTNYASFEGEEKKRNADAIKRFAEGMKKIIPTGDNLVLCIAKANIMFGPKTAEKIIAEMGMSLNSIVAAGREAMEKAYKIAIS